MRERRGATRESNVPPAVYTQGVVSKSAVPSLRKQVAEELLSGVEARRQQVSSGIADSHRSAHGQFFTSTVVARQLAEMFDPPQRGPWRVLDPGAGVGVLSAALIARLITSGFTGPVELHCFEIDTELSAALKQSLQECQVAASRSGIDLEATAHIEDFLDWVANQDRLGSDARQEFDAIIMNPPYRKIASNSRERRLVEAVGCGSPNLYSAFVTMATRVQAPMGQMVAITPRSFANGPYFLQFRRDLLSRCSLKRIHVYESRGSAFADTEVLQENIIWRADADAERTNVVLSQSQTANHKVTSRSIPYARVVDSDDPNLFLHLLVDERASSVSTRMAAMPETLPTLGLSVSTGMVVDFRCREMLHEQARDDTVPMVYPAHLRSGLATWPEGTTKPSHFIVSGQSTKLLLPEGWYVVVKRFSAKEEPRRVVAAVWNPLTHSGPVAFDNKTNVIHQMKHGLPESLARGITGYLNTQFFDEAFRHFSGNTQVNATDLRSMRFPSERVLRSLGHRLEGEAPWGPRLDGLLADSEAEAEADAANEARAPKGRRSA